MSWWSVDKKKEIVVGHEPLEIMMKALDKVLPKISKAYRREFARDVTNEEIEALFELTMLETDYGDEVT